MTKNTNYENNTNKKKERQENNEETKQEIQEPETKINHKSNKIDGVLYYFYRENKSYYDFLNNDIYSLKNISIHNNKKQSSIDNREKQFILKQKEYTYLWNEIHYYTLFSQYTPYHIYQIMSNIIKERQEYKVPYITTCSLCDITKVHSMEYLTNRKTKKGSSIIYITPGRASDHSVFYVCQHFILEVDKATKERHKFSVVFDFDNYQLKHVLSNLNIAFHLSSILKQCYPERLDMIYLIEPPSYIKPLLTMMKKMFRTSLYQKMLSITYEEYEFITNDIS